MLLAANAGTGRTVPYTVGVDGWDLQDVTTSGLPGQATVAGRRSGSPAPGQRRRPDVAAGRRQLDHAGPGRRCAAGERAVLPAVTAYPS